MGDVVKQNNMLLFAYGEKIAEKRSEAFRFAPNIVMDFRYLTISTRSVQEEPQAESRTK